jgi:hypothetical protein
LKGRTGAPIVTVGPQGSVRTDRWRHRSRAHERRLAHDPETAGLNESQTRRLRLRFKDGCRSRYPGGSSTCRGGWRRAVALGLRLADHLGRHLGRAAATREAPPPVI